MDLPDDPERVAQDAAADLLATEAPGEFSRGGASKPVGGQSGEPLITVEEATQRLGPKVMAALADKFNGELTVVRHPDEKDLLL